MMNTKQETVVTIGIDLDGKPYISGVPKDGVITSIVSPYILSGLFEYCDDPANGLEIRLLDKAFPPYTGVSVQFNRRKE